MQQQIKDILQRSIDVKAQIINNAALLQTIEAVTEQLVIAFRNGNKVLFCGNGGSAADAQPVSYTHLDVYKRQLLNYSSVYEVVAIQI